jgi:hypothetical protein
MNNTNEDNFPYKEIVGLMQVGYRECDVILFDLIDSLTSYLIEVNVREDKEFKTLLGEGYYK